jgi:hypothetical protein
MHPLLDLVTALKIFLTEGQPRNASISYLTEMGQILKALIQTLAINLKVLGQGHGKGS